MKWMNCVSASSASLATWLTGGLLVSPSVSDGYPLTCASSCEGSLIWGGCWLTPWIRFETGRDTSIQANRRLL